jgi:hypothetical protein
MSKIHIQPPAGYEPFECSIGFQEVGGDSVSGVEKALSIAVAVTFVSTQVTKAIKYEVHWSL